MGTMVAVIAVGRSIAGSPRTIRRRNIESVTEERETLHSMRTKEYKTAGRVINGENDYYGAEEIDEGFVGKRLKMKGFERRV